MSPEKFLEKLLENLISLGPAAILYAIAVHECWKYLDPEQDGDLRKTILLAVGGTLAAFLSNIIRDLWEEIWKSRKTSIANWLVSVPGLVWLRLTNRFQSKYYQKIADRFRDYQTQGLKTKGPFVLDLQKVFVPLRVAPETVDNVSPAMIKAQNWVDGLRIWDVLAKACEDPTFRRMAVIGPPGSGKTTMMQHLALTYAKNAQRQRHPNAPKLIPVLIYLRDIRDMIAPLDGALQGQATRDDRPTLGSIIAQQKWIKALNPEQQWFERRLLKGQCLVMLDGLDEVANEAQRRHVSQWVSQQIDAYSDTPFILTSRPFGYRSAPVDGVNAVLEVQPFSLGQMQQFIHNWYLQNEITSRLGKDTEAIREQADDNAEDLIARIKNSPSLAAMALNPLLLTMIATVHHFRGALPGRRVELYAEICDVLLGRRQDAKGISDAMTPIQKKTVLQGLALGLMKQNTREFTLEQGQRLIEDKLRSVGGYEVKPKTFLKHIENVSGLLIERENGVYEFAHKSFQEYLAAVEIHQQPNAEEMLIQQFQLMDKTENDWAETIRLYAAQSDVSPLIVAALNGSTVAALSLAYDCLEEGLSVEPTVRHQLESVLNQNLKSSDPEKFKLAVEVKLARRINRLLRIDDGLAVDPEFISQAEYQLYRREVSGKLVFFNPESANAPITDASFWEACQFCAWLMRKTYDERGDRTLAYRPMRVGERNTILGQVRASQAKEPQRVRMQNAAQDTFAMAEQLWQGQIQLVQFSIPEQYRPLAEQLAAGRWKEADQETYKMMLHVAGRTEARYLRLEDIQNFPCADLRVMDQLWVMYSDGHFGFSVQKDIWLDVGGTLDYGKNRWIHRLPRWLRRALNRMGMEGTVDMDEAWEAFYVRVDWRKVVFDTSSPKGHLPMVHLGRGKLNGMEVSFLASRIVNCSR